MRGKTEGTITITVTDNGLYLQTKTKGITYGQGYKNITEQEALIKFRNLIRTYQTKGDLYVARYGALS
jgi:hypothetical protein